MNLTPELQHSITEELLFDLNGKLDGGRKNILLGYCPFCNHGGFKYGIYVGPNVGKKRFGMSNCYHCNRRFRTLKETLTALGREDLIPLETAELDDSLTDISAMFDDEIDDELIEVIASEEKIVKYLDLPIQHCNSRILHLMNRRGDGPFLRQVLTNLRKKIPGLVIRTSVITGLPGEGEEEFAELCDFLKEMRMERVGAFPFSPEEGTPAASMDFPDSSVAQQRAQMVETIQSAIMDAYSESMIGKTVEVLVDGYDEEMEQFYGRTYADSPEIDGRVWIATDEPLTEGTFIKVCVDAVVDGDLSGYPVEE
jgi:ribosomal protein S12 methylthiotransferase